MFLGRYEHTLDNKGRLAVPSKYRSGLAEGLVVTRGIDPCLAIYPIDEWKRIAEKVSSLPITDFNARVLRRIFFAEATDTKLDGQGRILIPAYLREFAQLADDVVIVGMNTYLEVWAKARWQEVQSVLEREGPSIAGQLASMV